MRPDPRDDHYNRLLPMTAGQFYDVRHRLFSVIQELAAAEQLGGPVSPIMCADWAMRLTPLLMTLDAAWVHRRPDLKAVK